VLVDTSCAVGKRSTSERSGQLIHQLNARRQHYEPDSLCVLAVYLQYCDSFANWTIFLCSVVWPTHAPLVAERLHTMSHHGHSHGGQPCSSDHAHVEETVPEPGVSLTLDADDRVQFNGSMDFEFGTYSDAVSLGSPDEKAALFSDCAQAMTARAQATGTSSGSTFFIRASAKPMCTLEALAQQIFRFHTKDAQFDPERSGAEWWTQVIDAEDDIGLHWDKDYVLEDEGVNVHPHLGTVTYLNDSFEGAPTIVFGLKSNVEYGTDFSNATSKVAVSFPQPGKHMKFDGRMLHGAPSDLRTDVPLSDGIDSDELSSSDEEESEEDHAAAQELISQYQAASSSPTGDTPTQRSVSSGRKIRVTFLVNIWLNHIPFNSTPLPQEILNKLVCGRSVQTPNIKVSLVADSTNKNPSTVLRHEVRSLPTAPSSAVNDPTKVDNFRTEAWNTTDLEPLYTFYSDEHECDVFSFIPLREVCRQQFEAGRESFQVDFGPLPPIHAIPSAELGKDGTTNLKRQWQHNLVALFDCHEVVHSDEDAGSDDIAASASAAGSK